MVEYPTHGAVPQPRWERATARPIRSAAIGPLRVLLVDDDEDDWLLVRHALRDPGGSSYHVDWARSWEDGLAATERAEHEMCI